MHLNVRQLSDGSEGFVVCLHGVAQHGGVFGDFAAALGARYSTVALDLRGHGDSRQEPPWNMDAQVGDVLETTRALGIERAAWVGHSFGALVVAAVAARAPAATARVVLLDPGFEVPPQVALASAEIDRRDWTYASVDSAVNALLSAKTTVRAPREVVTAFARSDLRAGPDGRLRFSHSPSAVVGLWGEMVLPAPPIASVPTLMVRPAASHIDGRSHDRRYRDALGSALTVAGVPNGHNLLWEAPTETAATVRTFLEDPSGSGDGGQALAEGIDDPADPVLAQVWVERQGDLGRR